MIKRYEKYKESGLDWITKIPSGWELGKLKFNASLIISTVDRHELEDEISVSVCHYPQAYNNEKINKKTVLSSGTCNEKEFENFKLKKGQIIITKDSETSNDIGVPTFVEEDIPNAVCGYHLAMINANENLIHSPFLFRYLQSKNVNYYFDTKSNGVTRFGLGKPAMENLPIPIPSLEEQTKITQYLDHQTAIIDKLIQQKEKLIELLKEKRQAVINEAVTKGLNLNTKMKDSGIEWLGEVPQQWNPVQIRYLNKKVGSGVTPKGGAEVYTEEGVIFIRSQNVHFEGLRLDDVVKIDFDTHEKMSGSKVMYKDVLLNITGASIGRCCVVEIKDEMNVNQHVCIIRPTRKILSEYLNLVLQSNVGQVQIKLGTTGGNREGLTFEAIKEFIIPLPDLKEQEEILNTIQSSLNRYYELENLNTIQIDKMKEYRQSIISEAVTGKIDVREWKLSEPQMVTD